jgi:hypothetical protein
VSGFDEADETEVLGCLQALPQSLGDVNIDIVRDNSDQSGCASPIGLLSTERAAGCDLSTLEISSGQSTLTLHDLLMVDNPDFLCYEITTALADLWIHRNGLDAMVGYHNSFGVMNDTQCYPCPPSGACEARDVVDIDSTRNSHKRARIDLRESIAATLEGSWPYASVRWVNDNNASCSAPDRLGWVEQVIIGGGSLNSLVVKTFDVLGVCGDAARGVKMRYTPSAGGDSMRVRSITTYVPNDGISFDTGAEAGAGETWTQRHGTGDTFWIEDAVYWADSAFTASIDSCRCSGTFVDYDGSTTPVCN